MKRKVNVKRTVKVFEVYLVLILLATLFMTIAFANISDIKLNLTGNVTAIVQEGVFISDVIRTDIDGYVTDEIKYYRKTALSTTVEISSANTSYITYQITLYNNSGDDYYYAGLSYDEYAYDNTNITAVVDTLKPYITTIHPREELKFNLTFKYADGVSVNLNQQLNSILNFDFLNDYIEFTLDGKKYIAPNEITWEQFIESEYNTDSFKIQNEKIYTSNNKCILLEDTAVALEDKITKDAKYIKENIDITLTMNTENTLTQGDKAIYTMSTSSNATEIKENNLTAKVLNSSNREVGTATVSQGVYKIYGNSIQNGTPSPESPVEVQSVGDKTKNLFNNDTSLLGQVTYYNSSGSTGTRIGYKILLPPGTYTAHAEGTANAQYIYGCINSADNKYISGVSIVVHNNTQTVTFTINEGDVLYLYNGSSNLNVNIAKELFSSFNIQIEEGTKATDYEPYGIYKIPVKVSGKNLLTEDVLKSNSYVSAYGNTFPTEYKLPFIEANKTYTISFDYRNNSESYYYFMRRKDDTNKTLSYLTTNATPNGKCTYTFTAEEGAEYYFYGNNPTYLNNFIANTTNFQIEEGTEATEFNGYALINNIYLNEPLRKIGDYADYIDLETGQVVRNVKKIIANEFAWKYYESQDFLYIGSDCLLSAAAFSNYMVDGNHIVDGAPYVRTHDGVVRIINRGYWASLDDFNTWLASHSDFEIYYISKAPNYTETIEIPEFNLTNKHTRVETLTEVEPSSIEATIGSNYRITVDVSELSAGTYKIKVPAKAFVTRNNTYSEQAISTGKFTVELTGADNTIS